MIDIVERLLQPMSNDPVEVQRERYLAAQEITRLRAQPSPREVALAIKLIEQRRENYIRENCHTCANGGWWSGTAAQEEYVAELDDIIEMLRTAATKGDDHVG